MRPAWLGRVVIALVVIDAKDIIGNKVVLVRCSVVPKIIKVNQPIALTITIENHLDVPLYHTSYSLTPIEANGETKNVTPQSIYRNEGKGGALPILSSPKIRLSQRLTAVSILESGEQLRSYKINPGERLEIKTDTRKWKIQGGWTPGYYCMSARVGNLSVDWSVKISAISSNLCEFEIEK